MSLTEERKAAHCDTMRKVETLMDEISFMQKCLKKLKDKGEKSTELRQQLKEAMAMAEDLQEMAEKKERKRMK